MGGQRGSTTRQREAGKICCFCRSLLDWKPSMPRRERLCDKCALESNVPVHKVYMRYTYEWKGWTVQFFEPDLKTRLRVHRFFTDSAKIIETAERGGALKTLADRQAVDTGIRNGKGNIKLYLTEAQYRKLK